MNASSFHAQLSMQYTAGLRSMQVIHSGKLSSLANFLGNLTLQPASRCSPIREILTRRAWKAERSTEQNVALPLPMSWDLHTISWRLRNTYRGRNLRSLRVPIGFKCHLNLLPPTQPLSSAHRTDRATARHIHSLRVPKCSTRPPNPQHGPLQSSSARRMVRR